MATPINPGTEQDWDEVLNTDPMWSSIHTFSINDITGTFDGLTVGEQLEDDRVIIDFDPDKAILTKEGVTLYAIDSEFGFTVNDFEDASPKTLDNYATAEGFAGDLFAGDEQIGLVVSDSPTDFFKTPALLGTWLAGLGGNTVKASTENYVVMQNILSDQKYPGDGDDGVLYPLDDTLTVISVNLDYNGLDLSEAIALAETNLDDWNSDGVYDIKDVLRPNETEITTNIAVGDDYSVTVKDDGKLLYRWGNTIKKPNDIRMEATMDLPDEWDDFNLATSLRNIYQVTAAELVIHHTITNNPNDQIRPEDFENEAAIGIKPDYVIIEDYDDEEGRTVWVVPGGADYTDDYPADTTTSNYNADLELYGYYAGDGTFYAAGTILKDSKLADQWATSDVAALGASDGAEGYTNAWYTVMDREPFEPVLNADGTEYAGSGPRWRLQPDKYGQDLPSVTIPIDPSLTAKPQKDQVKYDVGAETQTVVNLLDWGPPASPLSISAGWQDKPGEVSINGMNYTDGFDMAVYIKGDIKPATIYSAELVMDYELVTPYAFGAEINGTEGDDFLVGIGDNDVYIGGEGGGGSDLVVLTYGSSLEGVGLSASDISGFTIGEDAIGLIDLGVDATNFDDKISQEESDGDLLISLDRDGDGEDFSPELIATLVDFAGELDASGGLVMEADFLLANPGPGTAPGDPEVPPEDPNVIDGTAASETLIGTLDDDIINGLEGNDIIYGLAGEDTIDGGAGLDRLYGGAGADVFVFAAGTGLDIVMDFEDGVDQIQLVGVTLAEYENDEVLVDVRASGTIITVDGDRMLLRGVEPELTADDFIFDDALAIA